MLSRAEPTIAARFIADEGALIQIETLPSATNPELHCAATHEDDEWFPHELGRYRIRVWVRRGSVATVLRSALKGNGVEAAAGLPVEVLDGGFVQLGLYETTRECTVPLAASAVGITYSAARWHSTEPNEAPEVHRLRVGVSGRIGDGGTVALLPGESWPASAVKREGGNAIVAIEDRCLRLSARVPCEAFMEVDAGPRSSSGSVASGFAATGGRRCFDITLQGVEGALPLCFDPRDVTSKSFRRGE